MSQLGQNRRAVTTRRKKWSETGQEIKSLDRAEQMVLCLSTKETDHGRPSSACCRQARTPPTVEQRQARGRQAAVAAKPRLVDPNQAADAGTHARPRVVQPGDR
jgi:hypothetical protein